MKILLNNNDLNKALVNRPNLGFVPTMGSLHKGHISLIKNSMKLCNKTIVSIYVNPTQFNNQKDFYNYPRNTRKDLSILKKMKVDFVYLPRKKQVYNKKRLEKIKIKKSDKILCAKFRKGHFEGVLDVMDRLTQLVRPKKIFMGEKDFQQLYLVKKFIENKYSIKIIPCKTIRNSKKLALSSFRETTVFPCLSNTTTAIGFALVDLAIDIHSLAIDNAFSKLIILIILIYLSFSWF